MPVLPELPPEVDVPDEVVVGVVVVLVDVEQPVSKAVNELYRTILRSRLSLIVPSPQCFFMAGSTQPGRRIFNAQDVLRRWN
jgi:hypothetical protein